jgi:hypothetical protein
MRQGLGTSGRMHGEDMIDRQSAVEIRQHARNAVSELSRLLHASENRGSQEEYDDLRLGVGRCIAAIDEYLLKTVYNKYPEMDDLIGAATPRSPQPEAFGPSLNFLLHWAGVSVFCSSPFFFKSPFRCESYQPMIRL